MEDILNFLAVNEMLIHFIVLAVFVGVEVIGKVPTVLLHTPLMSGANAIARSCDRRRYYCDVECGRR